MAASLQGIVKVLCRLTPSIFHPLRQYQSCSYRLPARTCLGLSAFAPPRRSLCKAARYKDRPWDYLESEEYVERYGTNPVWTGYRRNHKGGIPPQKTRKTCIRGPKTCGNPCPICRDPNIIVHHQNVKLLQQFIHPQTGILYDPTRTGVCMKQHKKLTQAVVAAQDHGLLPFKIPYMEFSEDYSNTHDAVGSTPPPPSFTSGDTWYKWYSEITPDQNELAKVKKIYKAYLK